MQLFVNLFTGPTEAMTSIQCLHRDPAVFNNMGVALGRLERYDDALEAFLRGGPEHAAWNNLGWVQYEEGHYAAAISAYERALLAAHGEQRLEILRNLLAAREALE